MGTRLGFPRVVAEVSVAHGGLSLGRERRRWARAHQALASMARTLCHRADGGGRCRGPRGSASRPRALTVRAAWAEERRGTRPQARPEVGREAPHGAARCPAAASPLDDSRGPDGAAQLDPDEPAPGVLRWLWGTCGRPGGCMACSAPWWPTTCACPCGPTVGHTAGHAGGDGPRACLSTPCGPTRSRRAPRAAAGVDVP